MIDYNGEKIRIRPSAIDTFYGCSYQWAKVFLEGVITIPNARAAIGTAVHKGVEEMWKEAQLRQSKENISLSMMTDAAIEEFQNLDNGDLQYDNGENSNTAEELIVDGTRVFVEDIVPYTDIPKGVEVFLKIDLDHPIVNELGGTIDYLSDDTVADVKTSKRKPIPQSYTTQQTVYKILAEDAGYDIKHSVIQGIAFTKNPMGHILELEPKVDRTRYMINSMLYTLEAFYNGVDPKLLFRGNPKYIFCSDKFCTLHSQGCPYVNGEA